MQQRPSKNQPEGRGRSQPNNGQRAAVWMRPALRRIVHKMLVRHLRAGTDVLEVGAGDGELSLLVEGALPPGTRWMSTDLSPRRPNQIVATLPGLPEISDGAVDLVAELSVADAIPRPVLVDSFAGMWRVLKHGGAIVRILDLREESGILGPDASEQGHIPLLYTDISPGCTEFSRQLVLIDRERLQAQRPALRQSALSSTDVDRIESWLDVRGGVLSNDDPPWKRNRLLAQFRRLNILAAELDLATYAQNRLMEALLEANRTRGLGFEIEFCGPVTEETIVKRDTLQGLPKKAAAVASRYGLTRLWENDPFGPHNDKYVRVRSTAIVLVACKPAPIRDVAA
jgi:hypothetical protein